MTSLLCSGGARGAAPFPAPDMHTARGCAEGLEGNACSLGQEPYTRCCCFEVFRHAIVRRDDLAWEALYARYGAMVRGWLGAGVGDGDEAVVLVFERFWRAVDAEKFARFDTLPAVLQYLKACARTARLDQARAARGETLPLLDEALALSAREDVADLVAGRVDAPGFWRTVRGVLVGEREELVFHLSYVVGLSPREICARHSARFPDVAEVYRLRRNLLDRLRRAPEVRALVYTA